jgi:uncharacterized protein (DUF1015 family)
MAEVLPLKGLRYAPDYATDMAALVTPPFDVITPTAQEGYYRRHPLNIIRLELGKQYPDDTSLNNRYTRAAALLAEWRAQGVIVQESQPVFYLYQQRFTQSEQPCTRLSLLGRVRLEPWDAGVVLPHEHTRPKDKSDRLQLLRACAANLSPIMGLYDDLEAALWPMLDELAATAPDVAFIDDAGEAHRLTRVTDTALSQHITSFFAGRPLLIADGHHRYETALTYRDELHATRNGLAPDDPANFVLMALVALTDPGLVVLPTHRLIHGLNTAALSRLGERLTEAFNVELLDLAAGTPELLAQLATAGRERSAFVLVLPETTLLAALNTAGAERMKSTGRSAPWQRLDVAVLQTLVLGAELGLSEEDIAGYDYMSYTRDAETAVQAVRTGEAQCAVLLNPTPVSDLRDVSLSGDRMPQKSTYFYPKLATGLVIHPLW